MRRLTMIQEIKIVGRQVYVTLAGNVFVEDAIEMREQLLSFMDKGHISFLFDLSQVDYIDCSSLRVLVSIRKQTVQKGGSVMIRGLQGCVKDLFELTRLNKVFEINDVIKTA